jgi:hypothetical protein
MIQPLSKQRRHSSYLLEGQSSSTFTRRHHFLAVRHAAILLQCLNFSQSCALSASIQQLAGGLRDLVMSDSSSPPPSPTAGVNDAKRIEDDVSIDSSVEGEISDDVPDSEKDTIIVESLDADDNKVFQLRAYQDEMLEASLKRNTIVVLNTGAGKTHMYVQTHERRSDYIKEV